MPRRKVIPGLIKLTDKKDSYWRPGSVFIIVANYHSSTEGHTYLVGVYTNIKKAISVTVDEFKKRRGLFGIVIHAALKYNKVLNPELEEIYEMVSPFKEEVKK